MSDQSSEDLLTDQNLVMQAVELLTNMLLADFADQDENRASMVVTVNGQSVRVSVCVEELGPAGQPN